MAYNIEGKVKLINDAQTFASGFTKREIIITVEDGKDGKYNQDISIEFLQDQVQLLDALKLGQEITVTFDIRGRAYNDRYFNNLVGWKVDAKATTDSPQGTNSPSADSQCGSWSDDKVDELPMDDDLDSVVPF